MSHTYSVQVRDRYDLDASAQYPRQYFSCLREAIFCVARLLRQNDGHEFEREGMDRIYYPLINGVTDGRIIVMRMEE